ncbi:MAG TPA: microcin C ABC transporter permease YejB [Gammaproteobacteria bacterium]|nr:microcin C ABC transporter permease YejB [Gammaproteobacteria bacterium]HIL98722.1 microcin C ABC transporter permease YejB [Pseudomonadales bacterium]
MAGYLLKRILLILPTLFGIMLINFIIIQFAPGGPVEQALAEASGFGSFSGTASVSSAESMGVADDSGYQGASGLDPDMVAQLEKQFGFDKPAHERFFTMIGNYLTFDFGHSYFQDRPVFDLVVERLPVSISLGLWSLLLIYSISVPLGIAKAVHNGKAFDIWSSVVIFTAYAIPGFLFAIVLIVIFAGGSYLDLFPLRGLVSENFESLSFFGQAKDYLWHLALPLCALTIGGFATLTMLTKNSFLEELNKQFVLTARAKGLTERRVLYGHIFRNAMLIVIAGFPAAFIGILFTGSLLIEVIFSLDGIGLLGFEAIVKRDYPILFGTMFCFTLIGLVMQLIGDLTYVLVDPRIDFEAKG